jgi:hypothetical protein
VSVPAKPGAANPAIKDGARIAPSNAVNPTLKDDMIDLGGTWHVHPSGEITSGKGNVRRTEFFKQPPSAKDIEEAGAGINIVITSNDKEVYFYNGSGVIGKPIKLKDFLKGC